MKLSSLVHEEFLFFTDPPVFSSFPPVVETLKNAEVSIECELSGTPPFEVVWYKDKRQLRSSKKYKIASKNFHASIHILNVDTLDIGEYHCKAQNEVGSDTCICIVKLKGKHYFLHVAEMAGTCKMVICFLFFIIWTIFPTISTHLSLFRTTKICLQAEQPHSCSW